MPRILVVDDEENLRETLRVILRRDGHEVTCCASGQEALAFIDKNPVDVVLSDYRMDAMDGITLLKNIRHRSAGIFVVMMTAYAQWDTALAAMQAGAHDFVTKPFDNDRIRGTIRRACEAQLHYQMAQESGEHHVPFNLVGMSPEVAAVEGLIEQLAATDATVLVTGESGTGKELVSRSIHYNSRRSDGPLVCVNAGALTPTLLESELFGHKAGAFTSAHEDRAGLFELANNGTLFLDEVGEISHETQVKLLRVLEVGEFTPVGGTAAQRCDVRIVAATNRNLQDMVKSGDFREDLYYRLAIVTIDIPPLRKRIEDIPLLAGHLLRKHVKKIGKEIEHIDQAAIHAMQGYEWPGNIRELDNRIQRALALCRGDKIMSTDIFGDLAQTESGVYRRLCLEPSQSGATQRSHSGTGSVSSAHTSQHRLPALHSTPTAALEPKSDEIKKELKTSDSEIYNPEIIIKSGPTTATSTSKEENPYAELLQKLQAGESIDLTAETMFFERQIMAAALEQTDHNLTDAAKLLGLTFRQIRYKAKTLGLR